MRKMLTMTLLGASWVMFAGCEQQTGDTLDPAEGLPQNEAPQTEPDVQIGQSPDTDPGQPAAPTDQGGSPDPIQEPAGGGADLGGGSNEPPPQN